MPLALARQPVDEPGADGRRPRRPGAGDALPAHVPLLESRPGLDPELPQGEQPTSTWSCWRAGRSTGESSSSSTGPASTTWPPTPSDHSHAPCHGRRTTLTRMSRIFTTSFASVYPHYVTKVEKKGRTKAELDEVIEWLTGFDEAALSGHLAAGTTFEDFFAAARLNPSLADHRLGVRDPGRGRRGPVDAEDPLPGQAGRRAGQGQVDGQGPESVGLDPSVPWSCPGSTVRPGSSPRFEEDAHEH